MQQLNIESVDRFSVAWGGGGQSSEPGLMGYISYYKPSLNYSPEKTEAVLGPV